MSKRLFVGGLPYDMTEDKLFEVFTACGRVEKVKIMVDRGTGSSKGFGFVEMATEVEGQAAILKFDGTNLGPRRISVKEAKPAEGRHRPASGSRHPDNRPRGRGFNPHGGGQHRNNDNRNQDRQDNRGENRGEHRGENRNSDRRENRSFDRRENRNPFDGPRPARRPGFGGGRAPGGFGRSADKGGDNFGNNSAGFDRKPHGRPGNSGQDNRSDWRSELGIGTGNNDAPRRDFRRNNNHRNNRNQHRGGGYGRPMDDNFGNR